MILNPQIPSPQPKQQPFHDIINEQIQNIYQDIQKSQITKLEQPTQPTQCCKESNSSEEEIPSADRTLKKELNKYDIQGFSTKTIREESQNIPPLIEENHQFDPILSKIGQVHRIINCFASFEDIKKIFLEEGKKQKLNMCQNTDNFATVKKGSASSCKCIINLWANSQGDSTIYQLRCINREAKRYKIILLEGQEDKFTNFSLKLMKKLANEMLLKLTTREHIEIFYSQNKSEILNIQKEVKKLMLKSKKGKKYQSYTESLLFRAKEQCNRLKILIKQNSQIQFSLAYERQFEDLCFRQSDIFTLYSHFYYDQYENYKKRRELLLKKWNLFDIFKQLEISEHFDQFRKRRDSIRNSNKVHDALPYMPAVKCLQQIKEISSPSCLLQKIMLFQGKIKSCYNQYFINKMRLSDMDDYLPITIYCVLAMDNDENLIGMTKLLLTYLSEQEEFEWEKKILTNLEAAFEFIVNEWKAEFK